MVTDRMTEEEFKWELMMDIPELIRYEISLDPKFRRIVIKAPKFPIHVYSLYTSKRRNKWIIILTAYSKKDMGERTHYLTICYYNSNHGYYAVSVSEKFYIYTPHFFSRYAQRAGLDIHGLDLIIHYFRHNISCAGSEQEGKLRDGSIQTFVKGSSPDGVWLGLKQSDDITLVKTFITREMAKGDQIHEFMEYELWRKKNNP